ncbi:MAG: hypothetical protein GX220_08135 [Treponema sp.]|mgnify:CR=1 FL=1|nr:hypothetical protein [Treponema sp.]
MNAFLNEINITYKKNFFKILTSFILSKLILFAFIFVSIIFEASFIASFIRVFAIAFEGVLQYGFYVIIKQLVLKEKSILGNLFFGIKDFRVYKTSLYKYFIITLCLVLSYLPISFMIVFQEDFNPEIMMNMENIVFNFKFIAITLVIFFVFIFTILLNFSFVWFLLFDKKNINAIFVIKKSFDMIKGKRKNLIKLCLNSLKISLSIFIFCSALIIYFTYFNTKDFTLKNVIVTNLGVLNICAMIAFSTKLPVVLATFYTHLVSKKVLQIEDGENL